MRLPGNVPHPIPYQGSKRSLAPRILEFIPHQTTRLVEPFAGSSAVSLAAAWSGRAKEFWLNDVNRPLISLWQMILDSPEEVVKQYRILWESQAGRERRFYDTVRARFNRDRSPTDFLYLLARCVKACVRYNSDGEFNNSPDNRRLGARPSAMEFRVFGAHRLLAGRTKLTAEGYLAVLDGCKKCDVVYMDPPYQGVCKERDSRYICGISHREFIRGVGKIIDRGCGVIISYDGRTGEKRHGQMLPCDLGLVHLELSAGRSAQATLLGRSDETFESLYVSPSLLPPITQRRSGRTQEQLALFAT